MTESSSSNLMPSHGETSNPRAIWSAIRALDIKIDAKMDSLTSEIQQVLTQLKRLTATALYHIQFVLSLSQPSNQFPQDLLHSRSSHFVLQRTLNEASDPTGVNPSYRFQI